MYSFNIFREKYHMLIMIVIIKDRQKNNQMRHIQETRMCIISYSLNICLVTAKTCLTLPKLVNV